MIFKLSFVLIIFCSTATLPQYNGHDFSISSSLVYTTSAEIYLYPNSVDPIQRNSTFLLNDVLNPSIDFRYRLSEPLIVGLSTEIMKSEQSGRNLIVLEGNNEIRLETTDGFELIPIEASLYYQLPFSTTSFKFVMGGGAGIYFGNFNRTFGNTDVSTIETETAFGIQVAISMEYLPIEQAGIRLEMKFRDPEFKTRYKYNSSTVNYNGTEITLQEDTFDSKVNVNGVTFLIGAAFYF